MKQVDFFLGLGSRYSYLAATQVPAIARETGARFVWRPLDSRALIARAGPDPFMATARRGQYDPVYRTADAQRWARYYGVAYREPDWSSIDWRLLALAGVAAGMLNVAERFAQAAYALCFERACRTVSKDILAMLAVEAGASVSRFLALLQSDAVQARHEETIAAALSAGAFGVPSFVVDGALFWGRIGCLCSAPI